MKIAISAESTVDLTPELLEKFDIHIVPFQVSLGERTENDGDITPNDIFNYVDETGILPKTSAVNSFAYETHFKSLKKEYDAIIHISICGYISSAINNAKEVASTMENVYVIDSLTLSTGIALLAVYGSILVKEGCHSLLEIVDKINARVPFVEASFVLNTVEYLYKGGRCTSFQRFGANVLRLKPQIIVTNGKLIPGRKFIGRNSSVIKDYCEDILSKFSSPDKSMVFLTHSHASPEMIQTAKIVLATHGFKRIYETVAGATITSHCGPKCLGILFFNDGETIISKKRKK